jgi:cell wall-associated NlpC family hydrolase
VSANRVRTFPIGLLLLGGLAACQSVAGGNATASPAASSPPPATAPATASASAPTVTPAPARTATEAGPLPFSAQNNLVDVWDAPENEGEYWSLQTQLVLGERVLVLSRTDEWSQIVAAEQPSKKDPRGYPGWVRSEALAAGWPAAPDIAVVMKSRSRITPDADGADGLIVYLDSRLAVVAASADRVQVRLPAGGTGWIRRDDVRLAADPALPVPADGLFKIAETFRGVPYRWGGTTASGMDCSGLPYRLFHAFGITLSRDSDDQSLDGRFVDRYNVRKGDLIFVSESSGGTITHEAVYWGEDQVLDADTPQGVSIRKMTDFFGMYYWITARRFLP